MTAGTSPLIDHDLALGHPLVAGADEAGRGCLAGPIVAAAVCLDMRLLTGDALAALGGLDDSKKLAPRRRAVLAGAVMRHARQVVVVSATPRAIDADGLHATNIRVMRQALEALDPAPGVALVDGFDLGGDTLVHRRVIKGDATSAAIAAASVVAKEARDRLMRGPAAATHPGYGFERHVGYITAAHADAVRALGPSPMHRMSFRSSAYDDHLTLFQ